MGQSTNTLTMYDVRFEYRAQDPAVRGQSLLHKYKQTLLLYHLKMLPYLWFL